MMASVAHNTQVFTSWFDSLDLHNFRLAKILSNILHDLYSIRPPSMPVRVCPKVYFLPSLTIPRAQERPKFLLPQCLRKFYNIWNSPEADSCVQCSLSFKYSDELLNWRKGLSRFLDAEGVDTSLLIPLFQRQRNVLNLAYYHALILVHRPFLLSNFASLNSRKGNTLGAPGTPDMDRNVTECLNAAMKITEIVDELTEGRQIFRAFWVRYLCSGQTGNWRLSKFTQYFAFCAVVVLYVYTIQQRNAAQDKYREYFDAAARCQRQISSMAENESLAQRYTVVLEERKRAPFPKFSVPWQMMLYFQGLWHIGFYHK